MPSIKKIVFFLLVSLSFLNMTCETDDDIGLSSDICDQIAIVSKIQYDNLDSDNFTFVNVEIIDDCLNIEIEASGCSSDSWEFNLIDSRAIAESSPEQRYLKFQLVNNEACLAVFKKTVSFSLIPLRINGSHETILHLEDFEFPLNYKY